MKREKVVLSWSGGKDSTMALYELLRDGRYEVDSLLTTCADGYRRISHHGVRVEVLQMQAEALGLPLRVVWVPDSCTHSDYERLMTVACRQMTDDGIKTVAFGDLFLADLRQYREHNLARAGMQGLFPIWGRDTTELVHTFSDLGFEAYLVAVDGRKLGRSFAGRRLDRALVADLPADVDPCGENGEYHSCVCNGPIFSRRVEVSVGEVVERDVRYFADLVLAEVV